MLRAAPVLPILEYKAGSKNLTFFRRSERHIFERGAVKWRFVASCEMLAEIRKQAIPAGALIGQRLPLGA